MDDGRGADVWHDLAVPCSPHLLAHWGCGWRVRHGLTVAARRMVCEQPKGRIAEYNDDAWNDEMPDADKEVP